MLKKRDLSDCQILFDLMAHPEVFPFVRQKASSYEEYLFMTKQTIEAEDRGELISRTIIDEWANPIGTISLFDIDGKSGFLGTWIGKPFHGKGYNTIAKNAFFAELFLELNIDTIYMRIRCENTRSKRACEKLPYTQLANDTRPQLFKQLNPTEKIYDLYEIPKDLFLLHYLRQDSIVAEQSFDSLEA